MITSGELMAGYESIVKFGKVNPGANGYEYTYWINGFYAEIINNGIEQWKPDQTVTDAIFTTTKTS